MEIFLSKYPSHKPSIGGFAATDFARLLVDAPPDTHGEDSSASATTSGTNKRRRASRTVVKDEIDDEGPRLRNDVVLDVVEAETTGLGDVLMKSASASVARLPTPPRTQHKRKRGGSKHSRDSDEDLTVTDDDDDDDAKLIKEAEDEESFWLSTNAPSTTVKKRAPRPHFSIDVSWLRARARRNSGRSAYPHREIDGHCLASLDPADEAISDSVPSSQEEKQTMAFVFRGVRRSLPNPHYNASINPNCQLPPEHPDFEPDERGVRKLLFAVGRKNAEQEPACCWRDGRSDEEEAEEETDMKPKLKPFQFNFTA
ncbi:hypothetical protein B0H14DRAFT_3501084 [Mycena olivaceomarginata]|nr:hypothetical protein B0H14DRAFT_3501084 [Mycena olivaceomarginata]